MKYYELVEQIKIKKSFLCVGLDSDIEKLPNSIKNTDDPIFEFNKKIINATADITVAYKPNTAFYEANGSSGWEALSKTVDYIKEKYPNIFVIADAKRGDIGNTSGLYARAFFQNNKFDAITTAPYMGEDSIKPFMEYENKWVILLALTSNKGANDFQFLENKANKQKLFENVLSTSAKWAGKDKIMYVVGATQAEMLKDVRKIVPENFLLVPGVGSQGGSLKAVAKYGLNKDCGLLVNSSRSIIFADNSENFAEVARQKALEIQLEMASLLKEKNII